MGFGRTLSAMSDAVTRLNAALEGRYAIERELGEGDRPLTADILFFGGNHRRAEAAQKQCTTPSLRVARRS